MTKKPVYIHYGNNSFDKDLFTEVKNINNFSKPRGGLWASRDTEDDNYFGWKQWCIREEYKHTNLNVYFRFTLKDDANVVYLDKLPDIEHKLGKYITKKENSLYTISYISNQYYIDFEQCCKDGIDAIEVTDSSEFYWALYGWDCSSIVVMNSDIIDKCNY